MGDLDAQSELSGKKQQFGGEALELGNDVHLPSNAEIQNSALLARPRHYGAEIRFVLSQKPKRVFQLRGKAVESGVADIEVGSGIGILRTVRPA